MAASSGNRNKSRISLTFDLGAVVAAIIALVGGIVVGVFGIEQFRQQATPIIQVGSTSPTELPTYTPYPSNPTYTPYPTATPYPTYTPYPADPTYTPYPTYTSLPTATSTPLLPGPTLAVVTATPLPLGGAMIGALNNDGSAATGTASVGLYPKTLRDAAGELHGDRSRKIYAFPDHQTAMATFEGLEPGIYVVCFCAPGACVTVGEVTIEPYVVISQNFRWPPSVKVGSDCEL